MPSRLGCSCLLLLGLKAQFLANDAEALAKAFTFIELNPPQTYNIHDKSNPLYDLGSENRFRCVHMRMSMVTNTLEKKFQSDNLRCGMFLTEVRGECLGESVHNLQMVFSDVLFSDRRVITPPLRSSAPTKSLSVPGNVFVKSVRMGWDANPTGRQLTSLRLTASDAKSYELKCSDKTSTVETFGLSNMERIGGLYVSYNDAQIADLDFLYHRVEKDFKIEEFLAEELSSRLKTRSRKVKPIYADDEYAKALRSNAVYSNELEDAFEIRGPYGDKSGAPFTDTFVFGHWVISEIYAWFSAGSICGIQAVVVNLFFPYTMHMEMHGSAHGSPTKVVVPTIAGVESAQILFSKSFKPCGFVLKLRNNSKVGLPCPEGPAKGIEPANVSLSARETIVGLAGTAVKGEIFSLGFLTLVLNGEDIMTL